ncbi:discoidin domain-containing protein [Paenibacillus sp. CC-CFT742]|nr:discoidin domain-containing protein [Paenibacillus sp. CC-CFT742]WJH28468.1 discoidin domain-containing protein [Paenibacillus sp. CC-CFT742]
MKKISFSLLSMILITLMLSSFASANEASNEPLIPVMTSNTAPSGIARASTIWSSNHDAYRAFDGIGHYGWSSVAGTTTGWVEYEYNSPVVVNTYTLTARGILNYGSESPKDWTFEAWNGEEWIVLDTREEITSWSKGHINEFSFDNETSYPKYRINITKNNGYDRYVSIGAMQFFYNPTTDPVDPEQPSTPDPTDPTIPVDPDPQPELPTSNRAILVVTMTTGLEKEYDLPMSDINAFLNWYDARDAGSGPAKFAINKYSNNKGPFSKRTDYVIFDKILTFEVNEYTTN